MLGAVLEVRVKSEMLEMVLVVMKEVVLKVEKVELGMALAVSGEEKKE